MSYTGNPSRARFVSLVKTIRTMPESNGRDVLAEAAQAMIDDVYSGRDRQIEFARLQSARYGGVVTRVVVMRSHDELREVIVALPYGIETHERAAREMLKWATDRDWHQIGMYGAEERPGASSIYVVRYYTM